MHIICLVWGFFLKLRMTTFWLSTLTDSNKRSWRVAKKYIRFRGTKKPTTVRRSIVNLDWPEFPSWQKANLPDFPRRVFSLFVKIISMSAFFFTKFCKTTWITIVTWKWNKYLIRCFFVWKNYCFSVLFCNEKGK